MFLNFTEKKLTLILVVVVVALLYVDLLLLLHNLIAKYLITYFREILGRRTFPFGIIAL